MFWVVLHHQKPHSFDRHSAAVPHLVDECLNYCSKIFLNETVFFLTHSLKINPNNFYKKNYADMKNDKRRSLLFSCVINLLKRCRYFSWMGIFELVPQNKDIFLSIALFQLFLLNCIFCYNISFCFICNRRKHINTPS